MQKWWVVVNEFGKPVPCMDGGKTLHHVALWLTEKQAQNFCDRMTKINRYRHVYTIKQVGFVALGTD